MTTLFFILTVCFIVVSCAMILIILVQRAQGGGLAGAFGGAGGTGTDTLFGGRVGDALTWSTVVAFLLYLLFAIAINRVENSASAESVTPAIAPAEDGGLTTPVVPVEGDGAGAAAGDTTTPPVTPPATAAPTGAAPPAGGDG